MTGNEAEPEQVGRVAVTAPLRVCPLNATDKVTTEVIHAISGETTIPQQHAGNVSLLGELRRKGKRALSLKKITDYEGLLDTKESHVRKVAIWKDPDTAISVLIGRLIILNRSAYSCNTVWQVKSENITEKAL